MLPQAQINTHRKGRRWRNDVAAYLPGAECPDRLGETGHDVEWRGWKIEAKNHRSVDLAGWIDQAESYGTPAAVVAKRRMRPVRDAYVVMTLETFLEHFGGEM